MFNTEKTKKEVQAISGYEKITFTPDEMSAIRIFKAILGKYPYLGLEVNYHNHTSEGSDGKMPLRYLARCAAKIGFTGLYITDHDNVGYNPCNPQHIRLAEELRRDYGIELYPGMELSCKDDFKAEGGLEDQEVHIAVQNIDPESEEILDMVEKQEKGRDRRAKQVIKNILGKGWDVIAFEEMKALHPNITLTHIASHVTDLEGNAVDAREFMEAHLLRGRDCAASKNLMPVKKAIRIFSDVGVPTVLNHPYTTMGPGVFECSHEKIVDGYVKAGLVAEEGFTRKIPVEYSRRIIEYDSEIGIRTVGGSDTHRWDDFFAYIIKVPDIIREIYKNADRHQRLERQD